jgi:hypothetical protein
MQLPKEVHNMRIEKDDDGRIVSKDTKTGLKIHYPSTNVIHFAEIMMTNVPVTRTQAREFWRFINGDEYKENKMMKAVRTQERMLSTVHQDGDGMTDDIVLA